MAFVTGRGLRTPPSVASFAGSNKNDSGIRSDNHREAVKEGSQG
jgi:hypothetical protein